MLICGGGKKPSIIMQLKLLYNYFLIATSFPDVLLSFHCTSGSKVGQFYSDLGLFFIGVLCWEECDVCFDVSFLTPLKWALSSQWSMLP